MSLGCSECVGRGYPCPDHHFQTNELPPREVKTGYPYFPAGWASHDAQGRPLAYPGPDGTTQFFEGYPRHWHEVHEHQKMTGPVRSTVRHSHADTMKAHEGYGQAMLDICAQCWRGATGLKGGGQKRFTAKPNGEQL